LQSVHHWQVCPIQSHGCMSDHPLSSYCDRSTCPCDNAFPCYMHLSAQAAYVHFTQSIVH
jgi:hypothetical protein